MSQALTTVDPKWTAVLSTIPLDLIDPRDYPRLVLTLEGVAECRSWSDIAPHGLSRPEYMMLRRRSKEFFSLAKEAESIANDIRHSIREQEAHERAVNGEMTPTVDKNGSIVDWYPKRSDKLLELLLKASDPKYKDSKAGESVGGRVVLSVSFGIPSRVPITLEGEIVDDDRSRALEDPIKIAGHNAGPALVDSQGAGVGEVGAGLAGNGSCNNRGRLDGELPSSVVAKIPQGEADEEALGAPAPAKA